MKNIFKGTIAEVTIRDADYHIRYEHETGPAYFVIQKSDLEAEDISRVEKSHGKPVEVQTNRLNTVTRVAIAGRRVLERRRGHGL